MIQQAMLDYQQIDVEYNRIERELKKSDAFQKRKQYKALRQDYEDKLIKLDAKAGELKNQLNSAKNQFSKVSALIDEFTKEMTEVESIDELNYMNKKVEEQLKILASLEKEIRAIVTNGEEIAKMFEEINTKLPTIIKAYTTANEEFNALMEEKKPLVLKLKKQMSDLEKSLDPKLFEIYKRISATQKLPVFVPLTDGNRCGGCRMDMPTAVVQAEMQKRGGIIRCEHCGRIIYQVD